MNTKNKIDQVLNITGLLQPQSFFLVRKTLEKFKQGKVLEIVSDKENSKAILENLCPRKKYQILEQKEIRGLFHFIITKN